MEFNKTGKKTHAREHFSQEEDIKLAKLVLQYGEDNWGKISNLMPKRNERQCKERWLYYLSPNIKNEPFTEEEDQKLIDLYNQFGSQWKVLASYFEGRTSISLRNRMNLLSRKVQKRQAIYLQILNYQTTIKRTKKSVKVYNQISPVQPIIEESTLNTNEDDKTSEKI